MNSVIQHNHIRAKVIFLFVKEMVLCKKIDNMFELIAGIITLVFSVISTYSKIVRQIFFMIYSFIISIFIVKLFCPEMYIKGIFLKNNDTSMDSFGLNFFSTKYFYICLFTGIGIGAIMYLVITKIKQKMVIRTESIKELKKGKLIVWILTIFKKKSEYKDFEDIKSDLKNKEVTRKRINRIVENKVIFILVNLFFILLIFHSNVSNYFSVPFFIAILFLLIYLYYLPQIIITDAFLSSLHYFSEGIVHIFKNKNKTNNR